MVIHSPNNHTAAAFGHGYIITIDGTGYKFLENGEYHLLLSQSFEVQVRMVACFSSSSCINAIAVRIEQYTLLVHSRFVNREEPVVFANGKRMYSLEFDFGPASQRFTFKRTSRLQFELSSAYGVRLIIRLYDRYLDVHVRVDNQTYCQTSQGLWGNCNFNSFDDLSSRDGEIVIGRNVSQSYINEVYGKSWEVAKRDSLFVYDINNYHEQRELYGGGYALYFNNAGAHTGEIYSFSLSDITIEFMVLAESENGTLLSYTSTKMFAVILESGKIKLRYDDIILDTLAVIQTHRWNHIALVWSLSTRILQFYHRDETGQRVHSRNFPITSSVNVFQPGGILALGYCRPPPGGLILPLTEGFIGQIDELRIWSQKLDPFSISANWRGNLGCTTRVENLASLWKFNEGDGMVAHDCVSSAHIHFQSGVWQGPTWVFSTVEIPQFSVDTLTAYSFRFGSTWMYAEQLCYDLIFGSSLKSQYTMLNTATLWFYHMSCVTSVTRSSHHSDAYWTLMAVSDFYQLVAEHSSWYAQSVCNFVHVINFPEWYGKNCTQHCKYGLPGTSQDKCVCMKGFYGLNCSGECPGGNNVPCSGQSSCNNVTGKCNCQISSNTTHDCSVCGPGWVGSDCSVSLGGNSSSPENFTCQGFGAAHYTTFDGAGYSFGTYGEFYLIKTNQFTAQVRQIPCMNGSFCISSVAVKIGSTEITIRASYNGSGMPLVWVSRKLTDATSVIMENNFSFHKTSPQVYEISKPGNMLLRVKAWQKYLSFEITSTTQFCTVASGLCSSCDSNIANDFTNSTGTVYWGHSISASVIISILSSQWEVSVIDSLFMFGYTSYKERREITANGYALNFNGTAVSTGTLNTAFIKRKDFTIQLFVKVHVSGGTILSYANEFTFAIVNDVSVKIYIGGAAYDMGIALPFGTWVQVSIVYSSSTGKYSVHKYPFTFLVLYYCSSLLMPLYNR